MLQICNRIQVGGGLLASEAAIQVAANGGMLAVPGKLADVVDMIGNMLQA